MRETRVLAGIDEAGLGPILGPLTLGYSAFRVPVDCAPLGDCLTRAVTEELDTEDWPDNWGMNASSSAAVTPPQALELRLQLQDWGEVRWLYDLPPQ